jgi:hypothetical protein
MKEAEMRVIKLPPGDAYTNKPHPRTERYRINEGFYRNKNWRKYREGLSYGLKKDMGEFFKSNRI